MRKDPDLEVTQRIHVWLDCDAEVQATAALYRDFIQTETLCAELHLAENDGEVGDVNGHSVRLRLQAA